MTAVRCTRCGHANRVRRASGAYAASPPSHTAEAFTSPQSVILHTPPAVPPLADDDDQDDDGTTCMRDRYDRMVFAEWTPTRGLAPLQLTAAERADELERRGYQRNPLAAAGGCCIIETADPGPRACGLAAAEDFGPLRVCVPHYLALTACLAVKIPLHT
jgi:hypothetical protein